MIAEKTYELLVKDTIEEEEINLRKKMLRFWPNRPTEKEIQVAKKKIK